MSQRLPSPRTARTRSRPRSPRSATTATRPLDDDDEPPPPPKRSPGLLPDRLVAERYDVVVPTPGKIGSNSRVSVSPAGLHSSSPLPRDQPKLQCVGTARQHRAQGCADPPYKPASRAPRHILGAGPPRPRAWSASPKPRNASSAAVAAPTFRLAAHVFRAVLPWLRSIAWSSSSITSATATATTRRR